MRASHGPRRHVASDAPNRGIVSAMEILVLGARGGLGRLVCAELEARGHRVTAAARGEVRDPDALVRGAPAAIVNCAGASVAMGFGHGWRGYRAVDTPIGLA